MSEDHSLENLKKIYQKTYNKSPEIPNKNGQFALSRNFYDFYSQKTGELIEKEIYDNAPKEEEFDTSESLLFPGIGYIYQTKNGVFLYMNSKKTIQICAGTIKITKKAYDHIINDYIISGKAKNFSFHTLPFNLVFNKIVENNVFSILNAKAAIKFLLHDLLDKAPEYKLTEILGFNNKWHLPFISNDSEIIKADTDLQQEVYNNATKMYKKYSNEEKKEIKYFMKNFIELTDLKKKNNKLLNVIIGWCMAAPFRKSLISCLGGFPHLYCYGDRSTGKTSLLKFYCVTFFKAYKSYFSSDLLRHPSQFQDYLCSSTFPLYVQEVKYIDDKTVEMLKEHGTGKSYFIRKKNFREIGIKSLKIAPFVLDSNDIIKNISENASNSRFIVLPFELEEWVETDYSWSNMEEKLSKYNLFSLLYDHTKNWTHDTIKKIIKKYTDDIEIDSNIEKNNPRIKGQYYIIKFGINLFNEIFETSLDDDILSILPILQGGRKILNTPLLEQFKFFCNEAIGYDITAKNPNYLQHDLTLVNREFKIEGEEKSSRIEGWFFDSGNLHDFRSFINDKYSMKKLSDDLKEGCDDKNMIFYHIFNSKRGIWIDKQLLEKKE